MFRCSECGCEYKVKPDFCDCGNDIFEEIYETSPKEKTERKPLNFNKLEILSWVIFFVCLLLSLLILMFFPKIEPKENVKENNTKTVIEKPDYNIPDLNSFWIDPQPVVEEPQPVVEQIKEVVNTFIPIQEKPKVQPKPATKPKPVVKQQTKPQQVQTKPQTTQQAKPQTIQQVTKPQPVKKTQYTYDIVNYRTALRQRLFSNLDIYKIEGHGKCGVQFAVDENGKLIKRSFMFKSDNKSVNEQVYNMLMRTPTFNPPPSSYANVMIRMTFELDKETYIIKFID